MCLYLPRYSADDADLQDDEPHDRALEEAAGEVVLIIDDDPTVRMLVAEVLGELGYAVMEAADGPSGLKILRLGGTPRFADH